MSALTSRIHRLEKQSDAHKARVIIVTDYKQCSDEEIDQAFIDKGIERRSNDTTIWHQTVYQANPNADPPEKDTYPDRPIGIAVW